MAFFCNFFQMKYLAMLVGLGILGYLGYQRFGGRAGPAPERTALPAPPPPAPPAILSEPPPMVLDSGALERVRSSTRDTDPQVRWEAAQFLLKTRDPQALEIVFDLLHRDSEPDIRFKVVQLLGQRRSPQITRHIVQALKDTDERVRLAALDALANIGDFSTSGAISAVLHDTDEQVRLKALQTLNALESQRNLELQNAQQKHQQAMAEWEQKVKEHQARQPQPQGQQP